MPRSRPLLRPRSPSPLAALAALALAACGLPDGTVIEPSEAARALPPPQLIRTDRLEALGATAAADALRIETAMAELEARRAALEARAAARGRPVIPPAERARLEAASAAGT
jgi:hypothetical protein